MLMGTTGGVGDPTSCPVEWNRGPSVEAKREEGFSHEYKERGKRLCTFSAWGECA